MPRLQQNEETVRISTASDDSDTRLTVTKQPHYIPVAYLKAWCDKKGLLWCRRNGGPPFQSNPDSVAKANRLYQFEPISFDEFNMMVYILQRAPDDRMRMVLSEVLRRAARATIYMSFLKKTPMDSETASILAGCFSHDIFDEDEGNQLVSIQRKLRDPATAQSESFKINKYLMEGQEPFMTKIENEFNPVLKKLREGCSPNELSAADIEAFLTYALLMLARLPLMFGASERFPKAIRGTRFFCMAEWIVEHYLPIGDRLDLFQMDVLTNSTETPFVTGDFPVRNLAKGGHKGRHLDIFFPIAPNKAILFAERGRFESEYHQFLKPTEETIKNLNWTIIEKCVQFVFASTQDVLIGTPWRARP